MPDTRWRRTEEAVSPNQPRVRDILHDNDEQGSAKYTEEGRKMPSAAT